MTVNSQKSARPRLFVVAALATVIGPGCWASNGQVVAVENRVRQLEKSHAGFLVTADRETKRMQTLATQVEESHQQLRETLARSGAKLGEMESKLAKIRGELEVAAHRLETIEKIGGAAAGMVAEVRRRLDQLIADLRDRAGIAILALPADLPADAEGFAKLAEAKLASGDIRTAAAVSAECQKRFPNTETAGRCAFVHARVAIQEQRYDNATRILQGIHDMLNGKAVPVVGDALLEIAKILELQGRCANAQKVLKYLVADMAKLPAAKTAKETLSTSGTRCKEGGGTAVKGATPSDGKPTDLKLSDPDPSEGKPAEGKPSDAKPVEGSPTDKQRIPAPISPSKKP